MAKLQLKERAALRVGFHNNDPRKGWDSRHHRGERASGGLNSSTSEFHSENLRGPEVRGTPLRYRGLRLGRRLALPSVLTRRGQPITMEQARKR